MVRVAVFQLGYETNTFMDGYAEVSDLGYWVKPDAFEREFSHMKCGVSGALNAIADSGAAAMPIDGITRGGAFNAGPTIKAGCIEEIMDRICQQLRRFAGEYDGVCIAMHGAGYAEDCADVDGYILRRVRAVVGEMPITASLDGHAIITPEMVALADGLFGIKTIPHIDYYEAGYLSAKILLALLAGKCRPKMALRRLPMLLPSAACSTMDGAGAEVKDYFKRYVEESGLIDATFFCGFSLLDSVNTCGSVLVVADGYSPEAEADHLARFVWERRALFSTPLYDPYNAVKTALSARRNGYVVINDATDNPGSGSPGDGTGLLREFLKWDLDKSIMGPIYDQSAARLCHMHKPGDRFTISVGGNTHPAFGGPIEMEATLMALSDGDFICVSPVHEGALLHYGPSARLRSGNVELIVVSNRMQVYDDRPFLMTAADLRDYRIVGLKSMNHFRAFFSKHADAVVSADTPGICPLDIRKIQYRKLTRPMYPLDENASF